MGFKGQRVFEVEIVGTIQALGGIGNLGSARAPGLGLGFASTHVIGFDVGCGLVLAVRVG